MKSTYAESTNYKVSAQWIFTGECACVFTSDIKNYLVVSCGWLDKDLTLSPWGFGFLFRVTPEPKSLATLSGLRIWYCLNLQNRSRMWLSQCCICCGYSSKKKKWKRKKKETQVCTFSSKNNHYPLFYQRSLVLNIFKGYTSRAIQCLFLNFILYWLTMMCSFQVYSKGNQLYIYLFTFQLLFLYGYYRILSRISCALP